MGERPFFKREDPDRTSGIRQAPNKGLVITTDFDKVDEIWTSQAGQGGKLWKMLPSGFVKKVHRNSSGVIDLVECTNKSVLAFDTVKSWKSNPLGSESSDWDFIHVDEPCPEKMFKAAARGLVDRRGSAWFTLTPLSEPWIDVFFHPRRKVDLEVAERLNARWAIQGSMRDNPTLTPEAIEEYASSLTRNERLCRIDGNSADKQGAIYSEHFSFDKHVLQAVPYGWESYSRPPSSYSVYYGIDPHPRTPHAVLFCAVSPFNQKFFFKEIFEHCLISELSGRIQRIISGLYVIRAKCDPLAYIPDPVTGNTIEDELYNHGLHVEKATKALTQGILRVKEELSRENNCYFSPELEETLWEFENYVWDEETEKPKDANDHMMENLYRLCLDDMRFVDQSKISNYPVEDESMPTANTRLRDVGFND